MNTTITFSRRPLFWFILSGIFIGGGVFSYKYFARAFPIVHLDITMNRSEACQEAALLAKKFNWGPAGFQQAAMFENDDEVQNFIELEGGGKKAFTEILEEKHFAPYTWSVRHFKESETNETTIAFTPEGKPFGFVEKLSENTSGAALTSDQAKAIALKGAQTYWNTNFSSYSLVESSQETRPSGRIDHTFVYENNAKKVGDAPYRLKLVVSGDKLTEYTLSIKVPEAFKRRYEKMRSANNTLAQAAGIIMLILYILGGCILGLFFLMRQRWLIWKTPILWAAFISLLQFLNNLNGLPLYWMNYNTQLTKVTYLTNFMLTIILMFFGLTGAFTLIFTAAESLGRKAFPNQLQLWRLWSQEGASSIQTLGRTIGGYLIIGFDMSFVIFFYYFAFQYLGWWSPSETLINPNILSYYVPWLAPVSQALQAGFMEECLFRAIPLSCAALIGQKRGNKKLWLIAGFILQAIIFSAAHASYPAQPFYARLVELIIPSIVFGLTYLYFGLLPSIISHFIYDLILMSLALFLSTAPGIWVDKILVITAGLVPLLIVLTARLFRGSWSEMPTAFYNRMWLTPPLKEKSTQRSETTMIPLPKNRSKIILGLGIGALFVWLLTTQFNQDGLAITISKQQALQTAQQELKNKNIELNKDWKEIAFAEGIMQDADRFVWRTYGKDFYKKLLGNYLIPAHWKVRFAQFDNPDIVRAAEEYMISIAPNGTLMRFDHQLPESKPGKTLTEQEARIIAHQVLKNYYKLKPTEVKEISAVSTKHPERLDWVFIFNDPAIFPKAESNQGEARINIEIAGDEIVDHSRYVFVPEQWTRADQQDKAVINILISLFNLLITLFLIIGGVKAIYQWINHEFAIGTFLLFFSLITAKSFVQLLNIWPSLLITFKTSEPYWHQIGKLLSLLILQIGFKAAGYALLAGFIARATFYFHSNISLIKRLLCGISLGSLLTGIKALCTYLSPSLKPLWADYTSVSATLPWLSFALVTFTNYIYTTLVVYLIFWIIDQLTQGWQNKKIIALLLFVVSGIALHGTSGVEHIMSWLVCGTIIGLTFFTIYYMMVRFNRSLIPLITGSYLIFESLQQGIFDAYPGAFVGAFLACGIVALTAYWWSKLLVKKNSNYL